MTNVATFPVGKLALFLRAMIDPEGTGALSEEDAHSLTKVEANVARALRPT